MHLANSTLKVSTLSLNIQWHNPIKNKERISSYIKNIDADTDILILPEMFSTGFTMDAAAMSEPMDGPTVSWMKQLSKQHQLLICGSVVIHENDLFYNRFIAAFPDGTVSSYDKRYLFTLSGENVPYEAGSEAIVFNFKGWNICPRICYDLRFPEWCRNNVDYDLLIFVASWPTPRINHWDALLKARAIENQAFVAATNRVGVDENGHSYPGHSAIYSFDGERIAFDHEKESLATSILDKERMLAYRKKLPFLNDM